MIATQPGTDPGDERARTRTAWLLFAPPFAVLALRFVLATWAESWPEAERIAFAPVLGDGSLAPDDAVGALMWQAAQPVLLTLGAVALAVLLLRAAVRAWGWRRLVPGLRALWLLLWLAAGLALLLDYFNRAALQPLPMVSATVLQARPQASSTRGPGGALAVLRLDGDVAPRRVLLSGADARALPAGRTLRLERARGRWWGEYLTGSDAPKAPRFDENTGAPRTAR